MATKPSIPKGTRDFSPVEMLRRQYIFDTIRGVFRKYGFLPLETPAMENLETLTGKYGEEGDRLIFKILKRGADLERAVQDGSKGLAAEALRYDLTVPFARYVVQHQHEITFPFKRYQIQPVWRADRPQKGRYREFYQCDADIIGSTSLLCEVDLVLILIEVFEKLGLDVKVHMNSRKVLQGLAMMFDQEARMTEMITILDKVDKIGAEGVRAEYLEAGFSEEVTDGILKFLSDGMSVKHSERHKWLVDRFEEKGVEVGVVGMNEVNMTRGGVVISLGKLNEAVLENRVIHDLTLARGLGYYTGLILEVKANEGTLQSSICGGGRYDDLTGVFGLKGMSGVGISFGADRIYDVLLETNKFPAELGGSTKLLFANFGNEEAGHCLKLLRQVRDAGLAAELYPDKAKMAKQFKYADDKGIPFVAIIGENELKQGIVTIKDMKTGEQKAVKQEDLIHTIQA